MDMDYLQEKPKLILEYPHKFGFNRIGFSSMIVLNIIVFWVLKRLMTFNSEFSDKMSIAIVLILAPVLIWFLGFHHFINGVKLEIFENDLVKYYTYGSKGNSLLHFTFELKDIEEVDNKELPFNCSKLILEIRNPIFNGMHEKKLKKITKVSIIADTKKSKDFMQEWQDSKRES